MNSLTHAKFSLDWLRQNGIKLNEPLVLLGSVLPDLAYMGFIPERAAHTHSKEFLNYLNTEDPAFAALGVGFMLHGEKPYCLDYFTHRRKGYIAKKSEAVLELVQRAKLKIEDWYRKTETDFVHSIIEFTGDTLIEPEVVHKLQNAFTTVNLDRVSLHLSHFFHSNEAKITQALAYFKTFDFRNLHQPKGIVKTFNDFALLRAFSHHNNTMERYASILNKFNFWRTRRLVDVITKTRNVVSEDYHEFLARTQQRMTPTTRHLAQVLT